MAEHRTAPAVQADLDKFQQEHLAACEAWIDTWRFWTALSEPALPQGERPALLH